MCVLWRTIAMSLINPINVGIKAPSLPETTGVLGFKSGPVFTASVFSAPGASKGGTETTGVNSFSSSSSSSGCSCSINAVV